jgi:hypothetical protein
MPESEHELDYRIERQILDEIDFNADFENARQESIERDERLLADADDQNAYERDLREIDEEEEKSAEELYKHKKNGFGMEKSFKMVNIEDIGELGPNDGMPYFFVSEAEGPMLSSMALKQILVLMHMIHSPISGDHVVETVCLKPTVNADNILEKLVELVDVGENPYNFDGDYEDALGAGVDDMNFENIYDFRGCGGVNSTVNKVVSVGEILVCPVSATYIKEVSVSIYVFIGMCYSWMYLCDLVVDMGLYD